MTAQKKLKKLVRERQDKTGESYQTAWRHVTSHTPSGPGRFEKILLEAIYVARGIRDERVANARPFGPLTPPFDSPRSPQERKWIEYLSEQSDADVFKLLAIMYAGREKETDLRGWCDHVRSVSYGEKSRAISMMLSKSPLADYLVDGLLLIKSSGEDIEADL